MSSKKSHSATVQSADKKLGSSSSKARKDPRVGPDGKTKQQRYVERNRDAINAKNALRNRQKRAKQKQLEEDESELEAVEALVNPSTGQDIGTDDQDQFSDGDTDSDSVIAQGEDPFPQKAEEPKRPTTYEEVVQEYIRYHDRELDAELDLLVVYDEFKRANAMYDDCRERYGTYFDSLLPQYWTVVDGWTHKHKYAGSSLQVEGEHLLREIRDTEKLFNSVLLKLPPKDDVWAEAFDMTRHLMGWMTYLHHIHEGLSDDI
ncbi:hypothetical protein JR316_0008619 [Psilocybe cubensis]|uniref:Uncharacterized protein n=2 Tax=Psilocybe cubensis TaxID=181762 RepID=A0ACB8GSG2_PSICU|nr:hypothetical protein JR316_0008619 [Psilocybe cubensis]KAH9478166.1 hypothetical protein JR316_0008619 [Psilocybe cubensis]